MSVQVQTFPLRTSSYHGWEGAPPQIVWGRYQPAFEQRRAVRHQPRTLPLPFNQEEQLSVLGESYYLLKLALRGFTVISIPFWATAMGILSLL